MAVVVLALSACKPNEAAYKAAYESAKAKRDSTGGIEGTVYERLRRQGHHTNIILGSDTLSVLTQRVGATDDGGATQQTIDRYNVVVAQFKQRFNARQMRQRILAEGYPEAVVLHTAEPLYYVVAKGCSTAQEALETLRQVESDTALHKNVAPFVLQAAHRAR